MVSFQKEVAFFINIHIMILLPYLKLVWVLNFGPSMVYITLLQYMK